MPALHRRFPASDPIALSPTRVTRSGPLALLSLVLLAGSATAAPLDLFTAMRVAVADAPRLAAQASLAQAAREDAARADALPDPELAFGIDNLPVDGSDAFRFGTDMMTMRRIELMQAWPSRGKRIARREWAEAMVTETEAGRLTIRREVERDAGRAWIARWNAEQRLALLDALDAELARAAEAAEARLQGGSGSALLALDARTERVALGTRRIAADAAREAAGAALARWIGAAAKRPLAAAPAFDSLPIPAERLRAALDRFAPTILAAARLDRAERGIAVSLAERRPDLRFGVGYGARSARGDMLMFEVGIGLPLFPAQRQQRDIAARRAEADAAGAELDEVRREQREQLELALARWSGLRAQVAHYRDTLLPLLRDRSRVALAGYSGGGELQPWLRAQQQEIELRLAELDAQTELAEQWLLLATLLPEDAR